MESVVYESRQPQKRFSPRVPGRALRTNRFQQGVPRSRADSHLHFGLGSGLRRWSFQDARLITSTRRGWSRSLPGIQAGFKLELHRRHYPALGFSTGFGSTPLKPSQHNATASPHSLSMRARPSGEYGTEVCHVQTNLRPGCRLQSHAVSAGGFRISPAPGIPHGRLRDGGRTDQRHSCRVAG